jgi:competence protein ComEC
MSDAGKPRKPRAAKPRAQDAAPEPQPDDAGRAVLERIARTGKGTTEPAAASTPRASSAANRTARKRAPASGKPGSAPGAAPSSRPAQSRRNAAQRGPSHGDRLGLIVLVLVVLAAAGAKFLLPGATTIKPPAGQLQLRFLDTQPGTVLLTSPEGKTLLYGLSRSGPDLLQQYGVRRPDLLLSGGAVPANWAGTKSVPAGRSRLGSVSLRLLDGPPGAAGLLLSYGDFRALLTGESGPQAAQTWLDAGGEAAYGPVQIYQGLKRGDDAAWLSAVRPETVVLSLGKAPKGTLGTGPDAKTLDLYRQTGARIWRSDVSGTVSFTATADGRFVAHGE